MCTIVLQNNSLHRAAPIILPLIQACSQSLFGDFFLGGGGRDKDTILGSCLRYYAYPKITAVKHGVSFWGDKTNFEGGAVALLAAVAKCLPLLSKESSLSR